MPAGGWPTFCASRGVDDFVCQLGAGQLSVPAGGWTTLFASRGVANFLCQPDS